MDKQEELREKCRFLKWNKGMSYGEIAKAIGMKTTSFYNFVSGKNADISYRKAWLLENYIKENEK